MWKKILVLTFLFMIVFTISVFANADLSKLDAAGNNVLNVVRKIGYWIILVKCMMDIIKNAMSGDMHSLGKTVLLYVLLYGTLFFVPWALRLIEGVF